MNYISESLGEALNAFAHIALALVSCWFSKYYFSDVFRKRGKHFKIDLIYHTCVAALVCGFASMVLTYIFHESYSPGKSELFYKHTLTFLWIVGIPAIFGAYRGIKYPNSPAPMKPKDHEWWLKI